MVDPLREPHLAHRRARADRRARPLYARRSSNQREGAHRCTRTERSQWQVRPEESAAMSSTCWRKGTRHGWPRQTFRRCSSLAVLVAQQSSGPRRKRLEPFKGSTCVHVADQSCRTGCMRELEHSRFELDVTRRPGRVVAPVHASLCAVIVGHPPSTRDMVETQNSSVARVTGAATGFPVRPRPGRQTCTWSATT
jgi:hypothetical protein